MGAAAPSGVGGLTHAQKRVEAFRSRLSPTARATRQLAKRQLTWLRSLPGLEPAQNLAAALTRA